MSGPAARRDRVARQERAGQWLRAARENRGISARRMATELGITTAQLSNYEVGKNAVGDDRAEDIAAILGMNITTVRRGLGLWVPEGSESPASSDREIQIEQALDEMRKTLTESGLFGRREIDRLVSYARFLESDQATDRDSHRD